MVAILALGVVVLREGLRARRARLRGRSFDSRRHRLLGRAFVALALVGLASGLGSAIGLRDMEAMGSLHAWIAASAVAGFVGAAGIGLRLEQHPGSSLRGLHVLLGAGGLLVALGGAVAGFAILP
jgi:hypothetical protein